MDLTGKLAIVTGASKGIGQAIALKLAEEGMTIALVARDEKSLKETATECEKRGGHAHPYPFDLTHLDEVPGLLDKIKNEHGELSVLVNNAGTYAEGDPSQADLAEWDQLLDLNFKAVYHLTNRALGNISEDEGAVVNVCSIAGLKSGKGQEIYSASKHALKAYAEALFEDIREKGIKVTSIYPGFVNTSMVDGDKLDPEKMIQPDDIASAVIWALKVPGNACPTDITIRPQRSPYI